MLKEYDLVRAKIDITDKIQKGCRGTIVMLYTKPSIGYEVEFFDDYGITIDVLTVQAKDIELRYE